MHKTLPTISSPCKLNIGVEEVKTCSETEQRTDVDLREVKVNTVKAEEFPAIAIAKNPGKTTARYALKSRHQKKSLLITRSSDKEGSKNLTKEFLVSGGKPVAKKRTSLRETNSKVNANQEKTALFTKRKNAPPLKKIKQNRVKTPIKSEQLPSLCDTESMADCEKIDQMTLVDDNELPEVVKEETKSEEHLSKSAISSLPSIDKTPLEDFSMEIESARVCSPRVLEFPLQKMKKYQKVLFEEKKAAFRKLDIDGDGHLSLFELMKSFPPELSKYQVEYLKMIYQNACSSTFFGLEEFLCVEEMCNTMKYMSEELQAVFARIDLRKLQTTLNDYLLVYSKAYDKAFDVAVFDNFLERANTQQGHSDLTELLKLIHTLEKDLNKGLRKSDFLLLIPILVYNGLSPASLLI
ncbi:uncharacterized protein LOC135682030 isoform X2 [Rhopilema esculentum]|uniref:uncharacterized protein LOC135682030 isoform X2 n=1 Tax=Rhopilema esculentum TaxID=499914 RepID=UPI0031CF4CF3